ncbi:ABC transporter ATP-binding protein [Sulfobacillus harzensis]|uniref:ABC transporter ATP-binding protein n=1 Tax=Sulfobacillus harzensis TaxID=2729629 RepID=A0A7Y0Q2Y8_9FIRM|nr:ABC transporter ATP-binding protein [Sulfobacillus harzensis]NMP22396.1 ABC transporter ATP-binding protein [Sulfobacillus harzensis]
MALAVEVRNLSKSYGRKQALDHVSFVLPPGAMLGLVGPNGAGKSTLMRMLLGLVRPTSGSIVYNGRPLWPDPTPLMPAVGGFVDTPQFYPYLSGRENLALLAEMASIPVSRVDEVLEYVHLRQDGAERVGGYSHGMRQRLGIAAALMKRPGLLILDEPQDGLDPARLKEMRQLVGAVRLEFGCTIIMSSHAIADVERLCDRIAVFDQGRVRYVGPASQLGGTPIEAIVWEARPMDRALDELQALGVNAHPIDEGRILAPLDARWDLADINAALIGRGVRIFTVMRRAESLESRLLAYLEDQHVDVR